MSIVRAYERLNIACEIACTPDDISGTTPLILGGVGRFDDAVRKLESTGLKDAILEAVSQRSVPVLGICLGMQLLTQGSEEGNCEGLGLLPGTTVRFGFNPRGAARHYPVPHMGWNSVSALESSGPAILPAGPDDEYYFNHAYHIDHVAGARIALTDYGYRFASAVQKESIFGVQFHPEKSRSHGAELLRRFACYKP